jgi:hypothetical protein
MSSKPALARHNAALSIVPSGRSALGQPKKPKLTRKAQQLQNAAEARIAIKEGLFVRVIDSAAKVRGAAGHSLADALDEMDAVEQRLAGHPNFDREAWDQQGSDLMALFHHAIRIYDEEVNDLLHAVANLPDDADLWIHESLWERIKFHVEDALNGGALKLERETGYVMSAKELFLTGLTFDQYRVWKERQLKRQALGLE